MSGLARGYDMLRAGPQATDLAGDHPWRIGDTPTAGLYRKPQAGATVTAAELHAFCAARLAGCKAPRAVRWADALLPNVAGKLLRHSLRANVEAR